ncbi:unnamed protein product [Cuscuta epithymum]|uniref:Uncharacterized protein n=1 Tax=Cuscuta epithymum TaxID=186058 RepID=A0AAV0G413_9ASTE|nr:unnamed protein product [Cuscuta epithymum]
MARIISTRPCAICKCLHQHHEHIFDAMNAILRNFPQRGAWSSHWNTECSDNPFFSKLVSQVSRFTLVLCFFLLNKLNVSKAIKVYLFVLLASFFLLPDLF